jgi:hypothetical protein
MAINPYLNQHFSNPDQTLIEDLIIEAIQICGVNVFYLPRNANPDKIYGEDPGAIFDSAIEIEMYFKNVMNWDGQGDFLSKFGLQIQDQGKLTVSMKRFRMETGLFRPKEGDLIYLPKPPLTDSLYVITYVEHEAIMHQLGKLQTWDIDLDLFNYSNQKIRTGKPELDKFENLFAASMPLNLNSGTGNFQVGEPVYQGTSLGAATAKALVLSWNPTTKELRIKDIVGAFDPTQNVTGDSSGAIWSITTVEDNKLPDRLNTNNQEFDVDQGNPLLNWDEKNPFGS